MKTIAIFGSTGSIGRNTVHLLQNELHNRFEVELLVCKSNVELLVKQAIDLNAKNICTCDENLFVHLCSLTQGSGINVIRYADLYKFMAGASFDVSVMAISGIEALETTLKLIPHTKKLALANKEVVVCAWSAIKLLIDQYNVELTPIDSEHNSLYRLLKNHTRENIDFVTITASGGAFFGKTLDELKHINLNDALKHPTWTMGKKITIDSATMANKGLEVIEAMRLFGLPKDKIEVVIHPQSIIHGIINLRDGANFAFLSKPDMRVHILHAIDDTGVVINLDKFDISKLGSMTFFEPDLKIYKMLNIAYQCCDSEIASCVFNVLNDLTVARFLNEEIEFTNIAELVEQDVMEIMQKHITQLENVEVLERVNRIKEIYNGF